MENILLIGGGGHCKSVLDAIFEQNLYSPAGIIDLKEKIGQEVLGIPVSGTDTELESFFKKGIKLSVITAGSVGDPELRVKLAKKALKAGFTFPNIIHPKAVVSKRTLLGKGNFVAAGAVINAGVSVGNFCIINTGAVIDHDCEIGDFVHIAPGCSLSGNVKVRTRTHIGTGTCIRQSISIAEKTIVGVGSAVVSDMPSEMVCAGNPCKPVKNNG